MSKLRRTAEAAIIVLAYASSIGAAHAQPTTAELAAQLRALDARVTALENNAAATRSPAASAHSGVPCTRLNANGRADPGALLEVRVNDALVGTHDEGIYQDLESFMRPGSNIVRLTFSSPGQGVNAELRCLPPGQTSSRATILTLRPSAKRLSAQTEVNLVAR